MPKENKKRGRRGEKRKHEDGDDAHDASKRRKSTDDAHDAGYPSAETHDQSLDDAYPSAERPFFGMLDDDEQEYFKRADSLLEANAFGDDEERALFLANVYKEADGKELKIAQSQSCSRLMERLIQLSTPSQLKTLFQRFSGNFIHLVSHRFASHCCEALFLRAAPVVTHEIRAPPPPSNGDTPFVTMENLFLFTLNEFEGSIGYLMTDKYASHVLRVLLVVLSGEPLDLASGQHLLRSKRKEGVSVQGAEQTALRSLEKSRSVPKAFNAALVKLFAESVTGLDTDKLRALSTHPHANPTLQLLLKLELTHFGKQRAKDEKSIIHTLLPDNPITAESGSAAFISGIVYDPIGSHLVEQIVEHAPGKVFKSLYKEFFHDRLVTFARNEIAGYVVCRLLERMGKDDLLEAHELLIPIIQNLLERHRTNVVRTLIQRCAIRELDTQAIAVQIDGYYDAGQGFDLKKMLMLDQQNAVNGESPHDSAHADPLSPNTRPDEPAKVHFNVLAQAMLVVPGSLSALILDSMVKMTSPALIAMSKDSVASRTLQAALTTTNASIIERRKLVQHFYGQIGDMSLDRYSSHVVDCIWEGTHGLAFIRERIAEELAENEAALRESQHGRAVWRNWKMDIYKRKRGEWIKQSKVKASNDGFQSFSEVDAHKTDGTKKTPLELARERHAKNKASKDAESQQKPVRSHRMDDAPRASARPSSEARAAAASG